MSRTIELMDEHLDSNLNLQADVERISAEIYKNICHLNPQIIDNELLTKTIIDYPELECERVKNTNIEKAKYNLSYESVLSQKLDKLLKSNEEAISLYKKYNEMDKSLASQTSLLTVESLHTELSDEIKRLENECEELESNLLCGKLELSDFTPKFMSKKTRFYCLELKLEKLHQISNSI